MGSPARRPYRRPVHQLRCRARRAEHDRSRRPPPRGLCPGAHGAGRQPVRRRGRAREGGQRRRPARAGRGLHRGIGEPPATSAAGAWRHDAGARCRLRHGAGPAARRARRRRLAGRARLRAGWPGSHRRRGHHRRSAVAAGQEAAAVRALHRRGRGLERRRPGRPSRARRRAIRRPGHAGDPVRAARLPQADLRGRRQALRAGREHRRAEPLRLGGGGRGARPPGRRRLAVAQGAAEAAHRRHGRPADQDRGRTRHPPRRDHEPARRRLRGVLRPLPLRRDRRSAPGHLRRARRHVVRQADGPADLRRRRLRQDRGGVARGLRGGAVGQAGRGDRADHAAGAPASPHLQRALPGPAGAHRPPVAPGRRQGGQGHQGGGQGGHRRHRDRHPRAARQEHRVQGPRVC